MTRDRFPPGGIFIRHCPEHRYAGPAQMMSQLGKVYLALKKKAP